MAKNDYPTEPEIRAALLKRADKFCAIAQSSRYEVGIRTVNDGALLTQIADGRNFTLRTYTTVMTWLDKNWPRHSVKPAKRRSAA